MTSNTNKIDKPADIPQLLKEKHITNLMYLLWKSRKDLSRAFNLNTKEGQEGLYNWYMVSVQKKRRVIGKDDTQWGSKKNRVPFHSWLVSIEGFIARFFSPAMRNLGKPVWHRLLALSAKLASRKSTGIEEDVEESCQINNLGLPGVTLIGYVFTESGMGEHIRMSASSLSTTNIQYGLLDFNVGVPSRQGASLEYGQILKSNTYHTNIFHINADQILKAYWQLGPDFIKNRYNIIYPFWELSKWPKDFEFVFDIMDEIWAPSRFIQSAIEDCTSIPVEFMPVCVDLPKIRKFSRQEFGLPNNSYLFLFVFDFYSYIERKNPFAALNAFKKAFPDFSSKVGLVIKVMNVDINHPDWRRMLEIIDHDKRVYVINKVLDKEEIIGLHSVVDSFVSLHRSEGFGFGPAEAMFLNKPVIVTNYSGNIDYTLPGNACLVDYTLIPVKNTEYIYPLGQVWADADIDHAAWYMRKLVNDSVFAKDIADQGARFIHENYNPRVIATNYVKRLEKICKS